MVISVENLFLIQTALMLELKNIRVVFYMEVELVANLKTKGTFSKLYTWLPIILLFVSVLNEFDFNYLKLEYFSFNFL